MRGYKDPYNTAYTNNIEEERKRNENKKQKKKNKENKIEAAKKEAVISYLEHLGCSNDIIRKVFKSDEFLRDILPYINPRSWIATALGHSSLSKNTTEITSRKKLKELVETLKSNASEAEAPAGGSKKKKKTTKKKVKKQYKTVKGVGKRLVRKYKSGGKYVMVGGKKMRI